MARMPWPGPAAEGRWDELSSGECALLGAMGAALTGTIVGAALAVVPRPAACRGRLRMLRGWLEPAPPPADHEEPQVGHGVEELDASRPVAVLAKEPSRAWGSERGSGTLAAALPSWPGARLLRTKLRSWKLLLYKGWTLRLFVLFP